MDERLHEAHDLVDEGNRVYDVDLLQTTWMGVLEEERTSFFFFNEWRKFCTIIHSIQAKFWPDLSSDKYSAKVGRRKLAKYIEAH